MYTASLNAYRQSPRKVRLVANLVKGKKVSVALDILAFATKRAGDPLAKLVNSALANAKNNFGISADNLIVKDMRVDKGQVLMRRMPRARGTAYPIRKRTSRITVTLAEKVEKTKKSTPVVAMQEKPKSKAKTK